MGDQGVLPHEDDVRLMGPKGLKGNRNWAVGAAAIALLVCAVWGLYTLWPRLVFTTGVLLIVAAIVVIRCYFRVGG